MYLCPPRPFKGSRAISSWSSFVVDNWTKKEIKKKKGTICMKETGTMEGANRMRGGGSTKAGNKFERNDWPKNGISF